MAPELSSPKMHRTERHQQSEEKQQQLYQLHGHAIENVTTTKYLGVNTQDNKNWGTHINTITNKTNKTIGFLWCNPKIGNNKTKGTAYKARVRPIIECAATV